MKKRLFGFLVALATVAVLAGCGTDDASKDISKLDVDKYLLNIGDYKNLQIEIAKQVVSDEDVNMTVEYMLASAPELIPVTGRALQKGDVSNINFVGKKDGVAFEGGTGENQELEIGSGQFIPGFEDALIGMEIGETRDIEVTFPEEYPAENLAGQPATFTVTLNSISEKQIPEFTDEYVAGLGIEGVTTVEQFNQTVKDQLQEKADSTYESQLQSELMNKLLDICEFSDEVPAERYEFYYNSIVNEDLSYAEGLGTDIEGIATGVYGYESLDDYYRALEDYAIRAVHLDLATAKIVELEGQKITSKVLNEEIENMFAEFGFESAEEFKQNVDTDDFKSYLINQRAEEILKNYATIVEPAQDIAE